MRALVTGGGGFVGGNLVRALLARGDDVISFQRGDHPELVEAGARVLRGDVANAREVLEAAAGVDAVLHVAAKVGAAGPASEFERINVRGTENVLEACAKRGVPRLVFCSSPSVVDEENGFEGIDESAPYAARYLAHYPRTKAAAERLVLAADSSSLATCALRPRLVFGPGDTGSIPRVIARARAGRLRVVGEGSNKVDLTYIDNVVSAHLLALDALGSAESKARGKAYFITNGEPVVLWDWLNRLLELVGLGRVEKRVSPRVARLVGKTLDVAWASLRIGGEPPITEWAAKLMATSHTFRIDAARRDLGYRPLVSLEEGTRRTVPWLKAELEAGRFD